MNRFDLIIFMAQEWSFLSRARYLPKFLAEHLPENRVLCVLRPICLTTGPLMHGRRFLRWLSGGDTLRRESENLFIFRPWIFVHDHLAARIRPAVSKNQWALGHQLRRVLRKGNFNSDHLVTWIYDPYQEWCLHLLGESLSVYECYDEYTASSAMPVFRPVDQLIRRERRVLGLADVVFVVSDSLYEKKRDFSRNIHVVPNAVDVQHFGRAQDESTHIPEDLAHLSRPLIGTVGNITERLDLDLLLAVARAHAEWTLVFVGAKNQRGFGGENATLMSKLERMPNVHSLGRRPYEALPEYLKAFDVCLIPYSATDPFNIHCSPLKLYEYLAAGKPIVSTNLPAVKPFEGAVRIGAGVKEFLWQIEAALEEDGERVEQRLELARENSWGTRAEDILQILECALKEKRS